MYTGAALAPEFGSWKYSTWTFGGCCWPEVTTEVCGRGCCPGWPPACWGWPPGGGGGAPWLTTTPVAAETVGGPPPWWPWTVWWWWTWGWIWCWWTGPLGTNGGWGGCWPGLGGGGGGGCCMLKAAGCYCLRRKTSQASRKISNVMWPAPGLLGCY